MTSDRSTGCFGPLLAACEGSSTDSSRVGWLLEGNAAAGDWSLADRFERQLRVRGGMVTAAGGWRRGLHRPLSGLAELADRLEARVRESHPDLVQGDDPVPFLIAAATALAGHRGGRPCVLRLDDVSLADAVSLGALRRLGRQAAGVPLVLFAEVQYDVAGRLAAQLHDGWTRLSVFDDPLAPDQDAAPIMPPGTNRLLAALSVFALPCPPSALQSLAGDAWETAETDAALEVCVRQGLLRAEPDGRVTFAAVTLRDFLHASLDPAQRRRLHLRALDIERHDPFAASWHAAASRADHVLTAASTATRSTKTKR